MSFLRDLKNVPLTGSRHPSQAGASGATEGERSVDSVDALASTTEPLDGSSNVPAPAPTNWVPSQQDDRPRH
jgi:hypothetical protein